MLALFAVPAIHLLVVVAVMFRDWILDRAS